MTAGAWRLQTQQPAKSFTLRTVRKSTTLSTSITQKTTITTLKCSKCSFEGPLMQRPRPAASGGYSPELDFSRSADRTPYTAHGVVYRWAFLFKSHVGCRRALRRDQLLDLEAELYACLLCAAAARGLVCFSGARQLCGHVARDHAGWGSQPLRDALAAEAQRSGNAVERAMADEGPEARRRREEGEAEVRRRMALVVGRRPDRGEGWEVVVPGLELEGGWL